MRVLAAISAVADAQGHGPDVGSEEWARALQWKLGIVDADGHGPGSRVGGVAGGGGGEDRGARGIGRSFFLRNRATPR